MPHSKPFIMDAAQHWIEPPDLWRSRLTAARRDRAPRVVALPEGGEAWSFDGGAWLRPLAGEIAALQGAIESAEVGLTYAQLRKGCYDGRARLDDLQADGIDIALVFPTFGVSVRNILDDNLHLACVCAYNDGVWEWAGDSGRLLPAAILPATGLDAAMAELKRVVKLGFKAVVFNGWPAAGEMPVAEEDAFWALCAETGVVVNLLRGGPVGPDRTPVSPSRWIGPEASPVRAADLLPGAIWGQQASPKGTNTAWLILTGILDRFPNLRVSLTETGAGWLPFYLEQMDDMYRRGRFWAHAKLLYMPSDYFRRQVKCTLTDDRFALSVRHEIGLNTLMWASGYPTAETATAPSTRLAIDDQFRDVPEPECRRILGENAAEWYGARVRARTGVAVGGL